MIKRIRNQLFPLYVDNYYFRSLGALILKYFVINLKKYMM